jgi:FAD:protein FMN transferase
MGTRARILLVGAGPTLADQLQRQVLDLEARWSRFVPTSEINALNDAQGAAVRLSPDTLELLTHARAGWEATYGLFDPTVLGDVERAGYDRSFDLLAEPGPDPVPSARRRGCDTLEVDRARGTARMDPEVGFDPGGIAKGFATDLVSRAALDGGAAGVLVDLGGDVRVSGEPPDHDPAWRVGIEDPRDGWEGQGGPTLASVHLTDGAVATSARSRRRWTDAQGQARHHLIDPRRGEPADHDVLAASVVAASGWQAEVLAKAAFVGGAVQGLGLVETVGAAGLVVGSDGRVAPGRGWGRYTAGVAGRTRVRA